MDMDNGLIMEIKRGDKNALGKLVERHKKLAYHVALGLVGNRDDAFDISQEAFLRVYRSAGTFDEQKQFMPWFYTIISNLSRTWLKRRKRNEAVDIDDVSYLLVDKSNPEMEFNKKQAVTQLHEALRALPFDDREIVTLQHFRGMSYDEIAELLDIPRGTVMSRLYYARKKLAKLMGQTDGK